VTTIEPDPHADPSARGHRIGSTPTLTSRLIVGTLRGLATLRRRAPDYLALTKPRIIELLLVATVPTMILAAEGVPSIGLVLFTLLGGTLAAGSANTLNCYVDRDIDVLMSRTGHRPLVSGAVTPRNALVFGIVLGVVAVTLMSAVNALAAVLTLVAILYYVVVYTLLLKRRTSQNIVWGGAAGCMPVLIGWAAVTGDLAATPWVLFGVIFLWTPPHYWPLSLRYRDDYAAAGVPMLPVVAQPAVVTWRILLYTWATAACSVLLVPVASMGWVYTVAALALGAYFVGEAHRLHRRALRREANLRAMRLFHSSITYLSALFVVMAVDPFLRF
jgi:protoheme IX farnesyltransferase